MLNLADIVLYNGKRKINYIKEKVELNKIIISNPIVPIESALRKQLNYKYLTFVSSEQLWVDSSKMLEVLAQYFSDETSIHGVEISAVFEHSLSNLNSRYYSKFETSCKVNRLNKINYTNYLEILSGSVCFIDVSLQSDERYYSTSVRLLQAARAGIPILATANTDLDTYWSSFPGKTISSEELSLEVLQTFVEESINGVYDESVKNAIEESTQVLNNKNLFQDILS